MGKALYRKYRPRKFDDIVGQKAITDTLTKAIKSGRISHAYLLSGPRGVGKTSVARILAHEINQLPYADETVHLDIIEIDGASNRRIDEVRDLRDKVHITPTSAKYKVYIIDEVHMLTKEAFNALLKTLEEPPAHCVFILATTEPHKLPDTIVSRTQRFTFRPVDLPQAIEHISSIAKREKIDIDREALELLAEFGEGSFRDSISLLDQISSTDVKITAEKLRLILGLPPSKLIAQLKTSVSTGDLKSLMSNLDSLRESGVNSLQVARQLSRSLRDDFLDKSSEQAAWMMGLLKQLSEVSAAKQPLDKLELVLLDATVKSPRYRPQSSPQGPDEGLDKDLKEPNSKLKPAHPSISNQPAQSAKAENKTFSIEFWPQILAEVKNHVSPLHAALRLARPSYENNVLKLSFDFSLHRNKVAQAENIRLLGNAIKQRTGVSVSIDCVVARSTDDKKSVSFNAPREKPADEFQTISNIFGSAEVLES